VIGWSILDQLLHDSISENMFIAHGLKQLVCEDLCLSEITIIILSDLKAIPS